MRNFFSNGCFLLGKFEESIKEEEDEDEEDEDIIEKVVFMIILKDSFFSLVVFYEKFIFFLKFFILMKNIYFSDMGRKNNIKFLIRGKLENILFGYKSANE